MTSVPSLFCFGFGYSARALSVSLRAEGWRIAGTARRAEDAGDPGIALHRFDGLAPLDEAGRGALRGASHVLLSIPPGAGGDPALRLHGEEIAAAGRRWVGYLSTTGVYGDRDGGWVDEESPSHPSTPRGRERHRAEEGWLDLWRHQATPVHLFRLAGIYGPGRSPLDQLRAGTARRIDKPGQVFSRIHVADLVSVLLASMARPRPGAIYNVCDDEPAPPAAVVAEAARLLHLEPPPLIPFAEAELSPMAASFYAENKRVRNDLIKRELGIRLRYPTYREGLAALLE